MSPRAAWRLESLGFDPVYDYVRGKADWMAAGLPTVRADVSERRALDGADRDPATCAPDTRVQDLSPDGSVIVINSRGIVVGRVDERRDAKGDRPVEEIMHPGPTTVRAHQPLDPLLSRMRDQNVPEVAVTTPEGELLGVIRGADSS